MSLLLGIDEGTSAVKAALFDEDLRPVAEARREKPLIQPRPGWVEQDPEVALGAVVDAVEGSVAKPAPSRAQRNESTVPILSEPRARASRTAMSWSSSQAIFPAEK